MPNARITGTGHFLPDTVVTNQQLEKYLDTSDEWIRQRTGITRRYSADEGDGASDLGYRAAEHALDSAGLTAEDVDLLLCCTMSPDYLFPSTACMIQSKIGAKNAAAFDVGAACSGFLYGLTTANMYIQNGMYKTVLVVGCESVTNRLKYMGWQKRDTGVLFGDGAGAVVLQAEEDSRGILSTYLAADGASGDMLILPGEGSKTPVVEENVRDVNVRTITMNGPELFKKAVVLFCEAVGQSLKRAGISHEQLDLFIPHQANARIIHMVGQRLGLSEDQVYVNIDRVGNTTAASIPIALDELHRAGKLKDGQHIVMATFGAGLTWASALMRW